MVIAQPFAPSFKELFDLLFDQPNLSVMDASSLGALVNIIRRLGMGVLVLHASDVDQLRQVILFLKKIRRLTINRSISVIVTTPIRDAKAMNYLTTYGAEEILHEPTKARSIEFKVKRLVQPILQKLQKVADRQRASEKKKDDGYEVYYDPKTGQRKRRKKKEKEVQKGGNEVIVVDPLDLKSDCWIAKGGHARKIMGRWSVTLIGPAPTVGRWEELEGGKKSGQERYWKWTPKDPENDKFILQEGFWVAQGSKPEFSDDVWRFVAKKPRVSFNHEGKEWGAKVAMAKSGGLLIARDSKHAIEKIPEIRKSIFLEVKSTGKEKSAEEEKGKDPSEEKKKDWKKSFIDEKRLKEGNLTEGQNQWKDNLSDTMLKKEDLYQKRYEEGREVVSPEEFKDESLANVPEEAAQLNFGESSEASDQPGKDGEQAPLGAGEDAKAEWRNRVNQDEEAEDWDQSKLNRGGDESHEWNTDLKPDEESLKRKSENKAFAANQKEIEKEYIDRAENEEKDAKQGKTQGYESLTEKKEEDLESGFDVPPLEADSEDEEGEVEAELGEELAEEDEEAEESALDYGEEERQASELEDIDYEKKKRKQGAMDELEDEKKRSAAELEDIDYGEEKRDAAELEDITYGEEKREVGAPDDLDYSEENSSVDAGELSGAGGKKKFGENAGFDDESSPESSASTEDLEEEVPPIYFDRDYFGGEGNWEYVNQDPETGEHWYVFVDQKILDAQVPDVREMGTYWVYLGPYEVHRSEDKSQWVFYVNEPSRIDFFGQLPVPCQSYLEGRLPDGSESPSESGDMAALAYSTEDPEDQLEESAETAALGTEDKKEADFDLEQSEKEERGLSDDLSESESSAGLSALGSEEEDLGPSEESLPLNDEDISHLVDGKSKREEEEDLGEEDSSSGYDLTDDDAVEDSGKDLEEGEGEFLEEEPSEGEYLESETEEAEALGEAIEEESDPLNVTSQVKESFEEREDAPEGIVESLEQIEEKLAGTDSVETPQEIKANSEKTEEELDAERDEAVDSIRPEDIEKSGPSLHALAFHFLLSELLMKRDMKPKEMANRFCSYLGSSCGKIPTEFWVFRENEWKCLGTSDRSPGRKREFVTETPTLVAEGKRAKAMNEETLLAAIMGPGEELMGAIVMYGPLIQAVPVEYVESIAKTTLGLIQTLHSGKTGAQEQEAMDGAQEAA